MRFDEGALIKLEIVRIVQGVLEHPFLKGLEATQVERVRNSRLWRSGENGGNDAQG